MAGAVYDRANMVNGNLFLAISNSQVILYYASNIAY